MGHTSQYEYKRVPHIWRHNPEAHIVAPKEDMGLYDRTILSRTALTRDILENVAESVLGHADAGNTRLSDFTGKTLGALMSARGVGMHRLDKIAPLFVWDRSTERSIKPRKRKPHAPENARTGEPASIDLTLVQKRLDEIVSILFSTCSGVSFSTALPHLETALIQAMALRRMVSI